MSDRPEDLPQTPAEAAARIRAALEVLNRSVEQAAHLGVGIRTGQTCRAVVNTVCVEQIQLEIFVRL